MYVPVLQRPTQVVARGQGSPGPVGGPAVAAQLPVHVIVPERSARQDRYTCGQQRFDPQLLERLCQTFSTCQERHCQGCQEYQWSLHLQGMD